MRIVDRLRIGRHLRVLRSERSPSAQELAEATEGLARIGGSALDLLFEALGDSRSRDAVSGVLERLLNDETLPTFLEKMARSERRIQSGIAEILERSHNFDPKEILPYLSGRDVPLRLLKSILLAREGDLPLDGLIDQFPVLERESRTVVFRILEERVGPECLGKLLLLPENKDWWIRLHAAKLLGRISGEESERSLERLLHDRNKNVRLEAVKGLQEKKARSAIPHLAHMLRDPDLTVQAAAIDALITIGDVAAVPHLVEVLQDESEQSRRGAVEVLNEIATSEAIQDLVLALRDADWWVRVRAADALGTLGGEKVVEAILGLMDDEDVHIRRYAVEILNTVPDGRAVDSLIRALEDEDWWVRERAIDALGRTGDARAVAPLSVLLFQDIEAAPLCVRGLGAIGSVQAVEPLLRVAESEPAPELRQEVVTALRGFVREELPSDIQGRLEKALREEGIRMEKTRLRPMAIRTGGKGVTARPEFQTPITPEAAPAAAIRSGEFDAKPAAPAVPVTAPGEPAAVEAAATPPSFRAEDVRPGTVLLGRYDVMRRIGRGGFSTVFLAQDRVISEEVILKIMNPHISTDERMNLRFVQELKVARRISHPNVIRIHDLLEVGEARAISMEYFPGRDIGRLIEDIGSFEPSRVLKITKQVAAGLAAAHEVGVIHRDMKPANILVGEGDEVKIVDFGLASATYELGPRLTKTGHLVGTPHYMAPEVIRGEEVDGRADLYSVGIVMYEMLAGVPPYDGENAMNILFRHLDGGATPLGTIRTDLPKSLCVFVEGVMARDVENRPADAIAFARELDEVEL
jgi:serine/threonine-protein kinase